MQKGRRSPKPSSVRGSYMPPCLISLPSGVRSQTATASHSHPGHPVITGDLKSVKCAVESFVVCGVYSLLPRLKMTICDIKK